MGLSCAFITQQFLKQRQSNCQLTEFLLSNRKMTLTRALDSLTQEYNSKLNTKSLVFYDSKKNKYNKMNYAYLMGYGANYTPVLDGSQPLKKENSMILTDYKGQCVLSDEYAKVITQVVGSSVIDSNGRGKTFSTDEIPAILGKLIPGYSEEEFRMVLENNSISSQYDASVYGTLNGDYRRDTVVNNSDKITERLQSIIDFYYPIFAAAAANGWTTEYNDALKKNEDYISDAVSSGILQLATVDDYGNYDVSDSLSYFTSANLVETQTITDDQKKLETWYNYEKKLITDKETAIDQQILDNSITIESIKNQLKSLESIIKDAIQVFGSFPGGK